MHEYTVVFILRYRKIASLYVTNRKVKNLQVLQQHFGPLIFCTKIFLLAVRQNYETYLEDVKKGESQSHDMEVFLYTGFSLELGARPGIYLVCKVTKTVQFLPTTYGLIPLQLVVESLSQYMMYPQHGNCTFIGQMKQVGHL